MIRVSGGKNTTHVHTHYRIFAVVPSAQLCVGRVLDVHDPAPHEHGQPGEEQVLHVQVGKPGLLETECRGGRGGSITQWDHGVDVSVHQTLWGDCIKGDFSCSQ